MDNKRASLTPEEEAVIVNKWTEIAYSGEYVDNKQTGTYLCRRCGTPLYHSAAKFDSHCWWPSFDDAIPGRVRWTLDEDGIRTEITCATCGGHLGHVFVGEQMTDKNTRHCVNSLSMRFVPEVVEEPKTEIAYFGGGCFWCVEAVMTRLRGVVEVQSGYMWGKRPNPTYEQVSTGVSWHIETVKVIYDPTIITYETLLNVFFTSHDPTSLDQQWHDRGEEYRSVIFYLHDKQKAQAQSMIAKLESEKVYDKPIVTEVRSAEKFRLAESYHQNFYDQHSHLNKPYCQLVINPKIAKLRENFKDLLKE